MKEHKIDIGELCIETSGEELMELTKSVHSSKKQQGIMTAIYFIAHKQKKITESEMINGICTINELLSTGKTEIIDKDGYEGTIEIKEID